MDKNELIDRNVSKSKKPLLGLLARRSTRVEPQNIPSENGNYPTVLPPPSLEPQNSPRRSALDDSASVKLRKHRSHGHSSANNNRLSHQFTLCCSSSIEGRSTPISVQYENQTTVRVQPSPKRPSTLHLKMPEHSEAMSTSPQSPKTLPRTAGCPLEVSSLTGSPVAQRGGHDYDGEPTASPSSLSDRPVFAEFQQSIAMTACRSRLRDKIMPPDVLRQMQNQAQHFSSPNINENGIVPKDNRSMSCEMLPGTIQRPPSTGSLARTSLMAAQVLNLIPAEKARERNFLHGRLASTSLLGAAELKRVLPARQVKIFVGSWNMNGQSPPKQMNDFVLPCGIEHVPDIIAIGTQESCSERFEWEVVLQETLGPSHILFHSANLGTLHLAIFMRRDLIWFCSEPEDDSLSVRPGSAFRTKGAVAISFCLFGSSMLFVTSHLTAHQQKVKERVQDIKRIIQALDLPRNLEIRHKSKDVTQNFDSVYWCGDLNFRLAEPREKLLKWIETTTFPLPDHLPHGMLHTDQLKTVLSDGAAFKGFKEAKITFPPTYKFDPGTQQFDTSSKQRAPAYTDRILYKYRLPITGLRRGSALLGNALAQPHLVECLAYDSVPSIVTSDHKPVWALFRNDIRPGTDSVPLAAGLFNRDVYLEGMRRRLNNSTESSTAVCAIQ